MNLEELLERGLDRDVPFEEARSVREKNAVQIHFNQLESLEQYERLADLRGIDSGTAVDIGKIRKELCSPLGVYKPSSDLVYNGDYEDLTRFLSRLFHDSKIVEIDVSSASSIDSWLETLIQNGLYVTHSSGTSGKFSFVPWDREARETFKQGMRNVFKQVGLEGRRFHSIAPVPFDGYGAFTSTNELFEELQESGQVGVFYPAIRSKLSADLTFSMSSLRRSEDDPNVEVYGGWFTRFKAKMGLDKKDETMRKFYNKTLDVIEKLSKSEVEDLDRTISVEWGNLEKSSLYGFEEFFYTMEDEDIGAPILLGGAPFQMNDIVDLALEQGRQITLPPGSIIMLGGGWKHLEREKMDEEDLVKKLTGYFGEHIEVYDTYGMTEGGLTSLKLCMGSKSEHFSYEKDGMIMYCHNFHIPHSLDVFVYEEVENDNGGFELQVSQEPGVTGLLGYILPFGSRVSVIRTDDIVKLGRGCDCGYTGYVIEGEITRKGNADVEGCAATT